MRRLSSVDAQFLAMEDGRTHAHVCQLTILEGTTADGSKLDAARIRELISERIDLMPPFRWRLGEVPFGLDYPVFVDDDNFDLDSHIWETALPEPGTDVQLGEAVGQIASRPLDRARPLWELHVIHGLAGGHVAMLTKVHHSAIDGVSGMEMLGVLLDPTPQPAPEKPAHPTPVHAAGKHPTDTELFLRGVASLPLQPVRMVRALPATLRYLDQLPTMRSLPAANLISGAADRAARVATRNKDGRTLERPRADTPKVSFGGRISSHRRFAFGTLSLETIKAIKAQVPGATLNDVVVALCAGTLRRRMIARGDDVNTPLVAMVPVSVRTKEEEYGNQISSMIVAIPTDEPDVRERVMRAHAVMRSAKDRHQAIPAKLLRDANHTVPPALFMRTARVISATTAAGWISPPFNVTISNIPGSPVPLYLAGAAVVSQHPVNVLLDGVGLSLTLLSYQDRLDFGFTADRELMPDVWQLVPELQAELVALAKEFDVSTS
ncbi:WS/DGAT/MGAT family O-acyltransferase [Gordonia rhizosphera]|uniref:Diacylglycerol O-acyltransferase n=1 Tax=Gordonia rhizosphera NBRC 16068 TaxID=1108045 RepID=K6W4W2_9ACTN|nr:wax ester/triacylglycerol synthase family O-acyltransferase [Gordonia rhizosphera]GAB88746.1 putative acyltransferase [Gordonia rhizosphera NBRC 16068]